MLDGGDTGLVSDRQRSSTTSTTCVVVPLLGGVAGWVWKVWWDAAGWWRQNLCTLLGPEGTTVSAEVGDSGGSRGVVFSVLQPGMAWSFIPLEMSRRVVVSLWGCCGGLCSLGLVGDCSGCGLVVG